MTMPAAHEPAFIVSKIGQEAAAYEPAFIVSKLGEESASTSASRSTSPGSSSPPESPGEDNAVPIQVAYPSLPPVSALPDFEYPVPFAIRNTFVDVKIGRPLSLEEFYEERRVHSCPIGPPPGLETEGIAQTFGSSHLMQPAVQQACALLSRLEDDTKQDWVPGQLVAGRHQGVLCEPRTQPPVSQLSHASDAQEVGSSLLPTIGSKDHYLGTCKPCVFYHTKGCGNGSECSFCHLCPAGEKERRKKERQAMKRDGRGRGRW